MQRRESFSLLFRFRGGTKNIGRCKHVYYCTGEGAKRPRQCEQKKRRGKRSDNIIIAGVKKSDKLGPGSDMGGRRGRRRKCACYDDGGSDGTDRPGGKRGRDPKNFILSSLRRVHPPLHLANVLKFSCHHDGDRLMLRSSRVVYSRAPFARPRSPISFSQQVIELCLTPPPFLLLPPPLSVLFPVFSFSSSPRSDWPVPLRLIPLLSSSSSFGDRGWQPFQPFS